MDYRKWRRSTLLAIMILVALALSGCGGSRAAALAGSSWPGITLVDNIAYVAFQNGVYAVDLDTCQRSECETLWQYSAASSRRTLLGGRTPVQFYAQPAYYDGMIVVGDYSESLHAIDAETGEGLWTFSAGRPRSLFGLQVGSDRARFIGGATVSDGVVYAGASDEKLYALDASDGEVLWTFQAGSEIWDAPLLADGVLYVPSLDHHLSAIDAGSGRLIWDFEAGGALASAPVMDDGLLYFGSFDNHVYAVEAESGQLVWKREVNEWVWDSPAVADGTMIVGDLGGTLYGLDSADGSDAWRDTLSVGGAVVATPLILDGMAYVGSGGATIHAVDVESGQEQWTPTLIQTEFTRSFFGLQTGVSVRDVPVYGPLIPYGGELIVGLQQGDDFLQAVEMDGGKLTWSMSLQGATTASADTAPDEAETEQPSASQQLVRWLPIYLLVTLLMLTLLRRQQSEK